MSLDEDSLFESNIQSLISLYKSQKEKYLSLINSLNQKLTSISSEYKSLQTQYHQQQSQITQLKQKLTKHKKSNVFEDDNDDSLYFDSSSNNTHQKYYKDNDNIQNQNSSTNTKSKNNNSRELHNSHSFTAIKRASSPNSIKKEQIICKDKNTNGNNHNYSNPHYQKVHSSAMKHKEKNVNEIDVIGNTSSKKDKVKDFHSKASKKFYSSDDNNSVDFNTNLSQINLLDLDNSSEQNKCEHFQYGGSSSNGAGNAFDNISLTPENNINTKQTQNQSPFIKLDTIKEESKYECVTFYQKVSEQPPSLNVQLDPSDENVYQCVTYYTKVGEEEDETYQAFFNEDATICCDYILSETKYLSELITLKHRDYDMNLFYDSLLKPSTKDKEPTKTIRYLKNERLVVCLSPYKEGVNLQLYNSQNKRYASINFDYFKLKNLISKINLTTSLQSLELFGLCKTFKQFCEKFLKYYITCRYQDGYKFGVSPNSIGVFLKKSINLKLRHVMCTFDMLVFTENKIRMLFTSGSNSINIDAEFDSNSFNLIFKNELQIGNNYYSLISEDYASDKNIINIGKNMQKLINNFCIDRYNTFDDLAKSKSLTFKCEITNNCNNARLLISDFSNRTFKVYELTNTSSIKNDGLIYSYTLKDLLGYEIPDLYVKTNQLEKTFISQIILNSVYLDENTKKIVLSEPKLEQEFKFYCNDRIGRFSHINLSGYKFLRLTIYNPVTIQECTNLFILDGECDIDLDGKTLEDYEAELKALFIKTVNKLKKGQSMYISVLKFN